MDSVLEAIEACPERFFATLTSRGSQDSYTLTKSVSDCFHYVNRAAFGPAYSRRGMRMATYVVQELNADEVLHAHCLLGLVEGWRTIKANPPRMAFEELLLGTWCRLGPGRDRLAQNIQPIADFMNPVGYVHKTVFGLGATDRIDVLNLHIPNVV